MKMHGAGGSSTGKKLRGAAAAMAAIVLAACSSGSGGSVTPASTARNAPLGPGFVDARSGGPLGADPTASLDAAASGARAGTLLARSGNGAVCVFANGRDGWNRAAC